MGHGESDVRRSGGDGLRPQRGRKRKSPRALKATAGLKARRVDLACCRRSETRCRVDLAVRRDIRFERSVATARRVRNSVESVRKSAEPRDRASKLARRAITACDRVDLRWRFESCTRLIALEIETQPEQIGNAARAQLFHDARTM